MNPISDLKGDRHTVRTAITMTMELLSQTQPMQIQTVSGNGECKNLSRRSALIHQTALVRAAVRKQSKSSSPRNDKTTLAVDFAGFAHV
jgi:hypothetical protein